jgi:hypothetical protein
MTRSIVLSGPMYSGKSTLAALLQEKADYVVVSARLVLRKLASEGLETRVDLQRFGALLEERTTGKWLGDAAAGAAGDHPSTPIVVDAARTFDQVSAVRNALGAVEHVHLSASPTILRERFYSQGADLPEPSSFEQAMGHPIEQQALALGAHADLILQSGLVGPEALLVTLVAHLSGAASS